MLVQKKKLVIFILLALAIILIFTACNKPTDTVVAPQDVPQDDPAAPPPSDDQPADPAADAPALPDLVDAAAFIEHTTIPTGTVIGPGLVFTKTWALKNTGNTTWTPEYFVIFDEGEQLSGPDEQPIFEYYQPLAEEVLPGEVITVTVMLTSAPTEGEYIGYWLLQNPQKERFGIGVEADEPFLVDIIVKAGAGLPSFGLDGANLGSGAGEVNAVQDVSLGVTPAEYSGDCPVQLIFSGAVDVEGVGPFSYEYTYDVDTSLPGWEYLIPPPQTFNYDSPGWHVIQTNFAVMIPEDSDGWIRLDSNGPDSSSFSEVYYNVDCNE